MFFIGVFGINNRSKVLADVEFKCTGCIETTAELIVNYSCFEIFFLPVYKYNKKYFLRCRKCESVYWINDSNIGEILSNKKVDYSDVKEVIYQKHSCRSCGKTISDRYEYCPNCGEKQ